MGALSRRSLCLFWRETQTKSLSSRSPARPEVDEKREVREKREGQLTKEPRESSRQRSPGDGRSAEGKTVKNEVAFVVAFVEVSRKIHAHDSLQMHEKLHKIVTKLPFLLLELTQVHIVHLFFLPSSRLYFFVAVKKCEIPRRKPLDESLAMNRS